MVPSLNPGRLFQDCFLLLSLWTVEIKKRTHLVLKQSILQMQCSEGLSLVLQKKLGPFTKVLTSSLLGHVIVFD